jgi:hypothetical protein
MAIGAKGGAAVQKSIPYANLWENSLKVGKKKAMFDASAGIVNRE